MRSLLLTLGISFSAISLLSIHPSLAQIASVPLPSSAPVELGLLKPGVSLDNSRAITANTVSQQGLTIPSLWWANEQFGDKLLDNWLAYLPNQTTAGRIDLIVNRQLWSLLDYLERYEFVNKFGTVARDYGYNIRVFNYQEQLLATYTCNFTTTPKLCALQVDATGDARVRGGSSTSNGFPQ